MAVGFVLGDKGLRSGSKLLGLRESHWRMVATVDTERDGVAALKDI